MIILGCIFIFLLQLVAQGLVFGTALSFKSIIFSGLLIGVLGLLHAVVTLLQVAGWSVSGGPSTFLGSMAAMGIVSAIYAVIFTGVILGLAALIPGAVMVAVGSGGLLGAICLSAGVGAAINMVIGVPFAYLDVIGWR